MKKTVNIAMLMTALSANYCYAGSLGAAEIDEAVVTPESEELTVVEEEESRLKVTLNAFRLEGDMETPDAYGLQTVEANVQGANLSASYALDDKLSLVGSLKFGDGNLRYVEFQNDHENRSIDYTQRSLGVSYKLRDDLNYDEMRGFNVSLSGHIHSTDMLFAEDTIHEVSHSDVTRTIGMTVENGIPNVGAIVQATANYDVDAGKTNIGIGASKSIDNIDIFGSVSQADFNSEGKAFDGVEYAVGLSVNF